MTRKQKLEMRREMFICFRIYETLNNLPFEYEDDFLDNFPFEYEEDFLDNYRYDYKDDIRHAISTCTLSAFKTKVKGAN